MNTKHQPLCTITVRGTQTVDGDSESMELVTTGQFRRKGAKFYILYEESDATGYAGCRTTLIYDPKRQQVTMNRHGAAESQLIIEVGKRHQCNYDTGCGSLILGVNGSGIESTLEETGGELTFHYSLDVNATLISENTVQVTVECR